MAQKTQQKLEIKPKTIQNSIELSLESAKKLISLEIDEIRFSLSSRYWKSKAREYPEYISYKNEQKRLKELQEKNAPQNEIAQQLLKVENAKSIWNKKAEKELNKANEHNKAKKLAQKEQENILSQENIILMPITE